MYWDKGGEHAIKKPDNYGDMEALKVNKDGSVIAGNMDSDDDRALVFIFTENEGVQEMTTLTGYTHSYLYDMDESGKILVGETYDADYDKMRAFIWSKDASTGKEVTLDLENTQSQIEESGSEQAETMTAFQRYMSQMSSRKSRGRKRSGRGRNATVSSQGSADFGAIPMSLSINTAAAGGTSGGGSAIAGLSLGLMPSDTLSFNLDYAMLSEFGSSDSGVSLQDNLHMFSASVTGGDQFSGFNWGAAIGYGAGTLDITRKADLENTNPGLGSADIHSISSRIDFGYSTTLANNTVVTPRLSIAHTRSVRDAYTETQDVLPVSYDKSTTDLTTAALGVDFYREYGSKLALTAGVGVEFDLSRDATTISGTSDVPGLTDFSFDSGEPVNKERFYASLGASYQMNDTTSLNFGVSVQQAAFSNKMVPSGSFGVQINF